MKIYANFEENLTCGLKKDMRNSVSFHQSTWKCQNRDFDGILLSKVKKYDPEIYRGVCVMTMNNNAKC